MDKNYETSIDIRWLCLIYFLIVNLEILVFNKADTTWLTISWGISVVIWSLIFIGTLIKAFKMFLKNRKDKNV